MSAADPKPAQGLQCMEIWGGNRAVERAASTPGLDVWVYGRPHEGADHGGGVHYVSLCGGGLITRLVLADVSGHGDAAGDTARALRDLVRRNINRKDQTRLVRDLNRQFAEHAKLRRFATAVVVTYLTTGDRMTVCNAGHPRPLWFRAAATEWRYLAEDDDGRLVNLPLGIDDGMAYTQVEELLGRGDLLLFYTDAVTEAEAPSGDRLAEAGLLDLVRALDPTQPATLIPALLDRLAAYRGGMPADDDLTLLLIHHNAAPSRHPGLLETLSVYAKVFGLKSV